MDRQEVSASVLEGLGILAEGVEKGYFSEGYLASLYRSVVYLVGNAGLDSLEQIPPDDRRPDHNTLRDNTQHLVTEIEDHMKGDN